MYVLLYGVELLPQSSFATYAVGAEVLLGSTMVVLYDVFSLSQMIDKSLLGGYFLLLECDSIS